MRVAEVRPARGVAIAVFVAISCGSLLGCGGEPKSNDAATPTEQASTPLGAGTAAPTATETAPPVVTQQPTPTPELAPTEPPLVLTDDDALEFAGQALEPYALTTFASDYGLDGCQRIDDGTAECTGTITYAIDPSNPQSCTLAIRVWAAPSKLDQTNWDSDELEEKNLTSSSGNHGDHEYVDTSECESAYQASAG